MAKLNGYCAVAVIEEGTYSGSKDYYYAIYNDGNTYKPGDTVLVSGDNKKPLTVKDIITLDAAKELYKKDITAEVICKVDTSAYDQRVENRKLADRLKKEMDKLIRQMDTTKKYEMYAAENPELADMLNQYKELSK